MTSKHAAAFVQGNALGVVMAVVGGLGLADAAVAGFSLLVIAYLFEREENDE